MANLSRLDTVVEVTPGSGEVRRYTFKVTDKNGKTASRAFTITFQSTSGGPTTRVDSLYNGSYTNQADTNGTHLRYQINSGTLTLQNRTQANGNTNEILFVYFYGTNFNTYTVISPAILRNSTLYSGKPGWNNSSTQTTIFKQAPSSVTSANFASISYQGIIDAYNNGTSITNEYYFLAQTFFLGGTSPQRTRALWGGGAQNVPLTIRWYYIHPLPTPSPPFSRGERVGVKGDRTPMYPAPSGPSS
jgi:hypothetical protein